MSLDHLDSRAPGAAPDIALDGVRDAASPHYAIRVHGLSKCHQIYERPQDRFKQFIVPRLRHVTGLKPRRYYRDFWALDDVSFEIRRGETVGVIGRNGSGKSTLLQAICGTLAPTTGSIETRGRVAALLELGAGFNPEFTGRENVYLNAMILGLARAEIDARFDDIAAFADIGEFIDRPVKTYSSGMYVRLAFAVAINVDPDILIVDEALSVGDARFQAKCMKRIRTFQANGSTILFVSHDVTSVRMLCDRALWLDGGKLRMDGDVSQVTGRFMEFLLDSDAGDLAMPMASWEVPAPVEAQQSVATAHPDTGFDTKPVTHWGSHIGCLQTAGIYRHGTREDVFSLGEEMEVRLVFRLPPNAKRDTFSVAFSIKDLKGSDLIVSTTHDWTRLEFNDAERYLVRFRFRNPLVTGHYLLVAAVEDHSSPATHYYEYLEGAHYFSSTSNARLFGQFQPEITQEVVEIHE